MYTHSLKKLPKNTFEIELKIDWDAISKEYDKAFEEFRADLEVKGYRKGNVPKEIAKKHLKRELLFQHALQHLLPKIYEEVIKKEGLKPIINPRIELVTAKENEPWTVKMSMAGTPKVELPDYKKIAKDAKAKHGGAAIWVPGQSKNKDDKEAEEKKKQLILNAMLDELATKTKFEVSDLVLEEELNSRLTRLVEDVQKLGLTMEAYLKSRNLTVEQVKEQYTKEISEVHKMEFMLNEIANKENIQIEPQELEALISKVENPQERAQAQSNAYFYAAVMRKQKTLDFLLGL